MTPPVVSNADPARTTIRQFTVTGKSATQSPVVAIHGWNAAGVSLLAIGVITDVTTPGITWEYAVPAGETWYCQFQNVQIAPSGGAHVVSVLEPR